MGVCVCACMCTCAHVSMHMCMQGIFSNGNFSVDIGCRPELKLCWLGLVQKLEVLKADNQRLKEENGALIRVISKLSK